MGDARAKHELDAHAWPSGEFAIGCNFVGNRSLTQKDHRGSPNIWKDPGTTARDTIGLELQYLKAGRE